MVPAGNKAKPLLSVSHTTKTIRIHHHYSIYNKYFVIIFYTINALDSKKLNLSYTNHMV